MTPPRALALHAHPDDIEFMMAGTLSLLRKAGYETHYMNVADGCCGSMTEDRAATALRRLAEAREAAETLGAVFHPPIAHDLEIMYDVPTLRRLGAVMRDINPTILLVPAPADYMEDHMNACRLAVTAAFSKGMPNYLTDPPRPAAAGPVTVYHALPWGLKDPLGGDVKASAYVDVASEMEVKRAALACHRSQKDWLDQTQGIDSYLHVLDDIARTMGRQSGRFEYAEGWRKRLHLGFCAEDANPLCDALGAAYMEPLDIPY